MQKRVTIVDRLMNERILLGGEAMTRAEAAKMLRREGCCERCIDITVFGSRAVAIKE